MRGKIISEYLKPRRAAMKIPMCFLAIKAKNETVFLLSKRRMQVCLKFAQPKI